MLHITLHECKLDGARSRCEERIHCRTGHRTGLGELVVLPETIRKMIVAFLSAGHSCMLGKGCAVPEMSEGEVCIGFETVQEAYVKIRMHARWRDPDVSGPRIEISVCKLNVKTRRTNNKKPCVSVVNKRILSRPSSY